MEYTTSPSETLKASTENNLGTTLENSQRFTKISRKASGKLCGIFTRPCPIPSQVEEQIEKENQFPLWEPSTWRLQRQQNRSCVQIIASLFQLEGLIHDAHLFFIKLTKKLNNPQTSGGHSFSTYYKPNKVKTSRCLRLGQRLQLKHKIDHLRPGSKSWWEFLWKIRTFKSSQLYRGK